MIAESKGTMPRDLFFWSLVQGDEELAHALWRFCSKPLHMALLGARICDAQ